MEHDNNPQPATAQVIMVECTEGMGIRGDVEMERLHSSLSRALVIDSWKRLLPGQLAVYQGVILSILLSQPNSLTFFLSPICAKILLLCMQRAGS